MSENDADELSDTREKEVDLGGGGGKRLARSPAQRLLEREDSTLDQNAVSIQVIPVFSGAWDSGIKAQILVGIGVNAAPIRRSGTGIVTITNHLGGAVKSLRFVANPLKASGAIRAAANTFKYEGCLIPRTNGSAVCVKLSGKAGRMARIEGDAHSFEVELISEDRVVVVGIESGIAQEGLIRERRMGAEEILQNGFQGNGIPNFLVESRVVGFLGNHLRVPAPKRIVKESDVADDTQSVGNNA